MENINPILGRIQKEAYAQAQASSGGVSAPASPTELAQQCLGNQWLRSPHLELLNRELVAAAAGKLREEGYVGLLISLPPGHGKSTLVNQWFPSWYIGTHPSENVISTSYEADFAASWGRKTRDILAEHGKRFFDVAVRDDNSAASWWEIAGHGGGMMTAGVGGPLTGKRGRVLILDDFCKNAEEAASPTMRQKWWDWYVSTFRTRLEPEGFIVIIATRWHDDDLIGRIIRRMESDPGADRFKVIRLPAIAEENDLLGRQPGQPLWPERYDLAELDKIRRNDPRVWCALYQQAPRSIEGAMFRREWFQFVDTPLPCVKTVRFWDTAATEATQDTDPDWTVGAKLGIDRSNRVTILDIRRVRGTPRQVEEFIRQTTIEDGAGVLVRIEQEPGAAGLIVVDHYQRRVLLGFDVRGVPTNGNKVSRANPLSEFAKSGNLLLLRASWNPVLLDELEAFPKGLHDDQVDACSGAFAELSVVTITTPEVETEADKLRVEPLAYELRWWLARSWNLSGPMLCCVWFQIEPLCGDEVRVKVLLEMHSETDSVTGFVKQVLETTDKFSRAARPHDIVIVPKIPVDDEMREKMRPFWAQNAGARTVRWEPERFYGVFGEMLKVGGISVNQDCPSIVQAIHSGCCRNRSGGVAVDSYWEPLARAVIGGIAAAFTVARPPLR